MSKDVEGHLPLPFRWEEGLNETSKKHSRPWCGKVKIGGAEGTRTPCLLLAKQALSLMSYSPTLVAGGGRGRLAIELLIVAAFNARLFFIVGQTRCKIKGPVS